MTVVDNGAVTVIVLVGVALGLAFAALYAYHTSLIKIGAAAADAYAHADRSSAATDRLVDESRHTDSAHGGADHEQVSLPEALKNVETIADAIAVGANAFLFKEYQYLSIFIVLFSVVLLLLIGFVHSWASAIFTVICFVTGALTSILCGFIGMRIAVYANSRTCVAALNGFGPAFVTSFKAGCVMGFSLTAIGIIVLFILINILSAHWSDAESNIDRSQQMYEALAGYGLGGSSIALFGRVGGGIYTKAADVGADLVGKVERGLPEDDPRNPAVIADNVGDNVGDIAGMGADLFGSFAESACAAMVVASQSPTLFNSWPAMCFPLVLSACGIVVCILTSFVATNLMVVSKETEIEPSLKRQILVSTLLMTPVVFIVTYYFLPDTFSIASKTGIKNWHIFFCVICGLWSGMIIGYTTEYYTSHSYTPVREVANACETGPATNIIYGLALGYKSVIIPVFCLAITIYVSYSLAGMFGIACGALGILSPLAIDLTIDAYGPICDNAGGIAEMSHLPAEVREKTDALDGAGNTTAAIGKGFAIGSAALVSLALFGAFVTTVGLAQSGGVNILEPFQFAGLLVGAMLPYWFSAMTMKSVGKAALDMVVEVRRQLKEHPEILEWKVKPDYARCVGISTEASLREMIAPGALVMLSPIIVGFLFGVEALAGLLAGALVSGVQMAISASNTGGAWDNAKKYIAAGGLGKDKMKHTPQHDAAVIGDTVGDPLKDTSGPSLNILIKLMAIISVVLASAFPSKGLLVQLFNS